MSIYLKKFRHCAGWQKGERIKEQKLKPPHTTEPNGVVAGIVRAA
jgi:hypothetical protein